MAANLAKWVIELAIVIIKLTNKVNDIAIQQLPGPESHRPLAKCEVKIYDGSRDPEGLHTWILDIETWFTYNETTDVDMVPFAKLKLSNVDKVLIIERKYAQDPITTWNQLVAALKDTFYPSNYEQ